MSLTNKNKRYGKVSSRVTSFSIPDGDVTAHNDVKKLKEHCKKTGISFSYLVLKGIANINRELGL